MVAEDGRKREKGSDTFNYSLTCVALSTILLLLSISGCEKNSSETDRNDSVVYTIRKVVKHPSWPSDVRGRADMAISQWENGVHDFVPILISAYLTKGLEEFSEINLNLPIFDEDMDVLGIGIKERHIKQGGQIEIIEENYSIYAHTPFSDVMDLHWVPVKIRTAGKQKDLNLWKEYVNSDYGEIAYEIIHSEQLEKATFKIHPLPDVNIVDFSFVWAATLPPVWVSIPEPNEVDVWIWVYDKAGNKSEPVKLLNFIDKEENHKWPIKMLGKEESIKIASIFSVSAGLDLDTWELIYDDNNELWKQNFDELSSKFWRKIRQYKKFKDSSKYQAVYIKYTGLGLGGSYFVFIDQESGKVVDNTHCSELRRFTENQNAQGN